MSTSQPEHSKKMDETGDTPAKGSDYILDFRKKTADIFGVKMTLVGGYYAMGPYVEDVLIKKEAKLKKSQFDIIKTIRHPSVISILNFYPESSNMGRFVIPKMDASFNSWFHARGRRVMFKPNGEMTEFFRRLIIDFCEIVETVHAMKLVLAENICTKDLFVKMLADDKPKILLLITQVRPSKNPSLEGGPNWVAIKDFAEWCFSKAEFLMDGLSSWFIAFIGAESFSIEKMKSYPDNWNWRKKGEYLMALKSEKIGSVKDALKRTNISWPDPLPSKLNKIIDCSARQNFYYHKNLPYDYLKILWSAYKHFRKLGMAEVFGNPEGFVGHIEMWTPSIWIELFEILGWPGSSPVL